VLRVQISTRDNPSSGIFRHAFDADRTQVLIGRRIGVDVLLPDPKVSLVHARVERRDGQYLISDEKSTNGTFVNGVRLPRGEMRTLRDGDRVVIGRYELVMGLIPTGDWTAEASSSLARRMVQEVLERLGTGESQPALHVLDGPQTGVVLRLDAIGRSWMLGRAGQGDLRLDDVDPGLPRAQLSRTVEAVTLRPLEPRPHLLVNGEPVSGARTLKDGDQVDFHGTVLRFVDPAEVYLRKLSAGPDDADANVAVLRPPDDAERVRAAKVDRNATTRRDGDGRSPLELWLIVGGLAVAFAAIAGLIWVLAS
jgi:pSer/pThr/pTyr-binding forkhead associated (FHA) protein